MASSRAVLELHRKKRLEVALAPFPRWLSFKLGKEIGLTHNGKVNGAGCNPTTYFINVPSATFATYNDYLSMKFVDDQIVSMASRERSVPLGIRLSLSTSAREKSAQDAPNLVRLSSVKQRSSFVSAELLQEGRALVDKKSKGQMRKDEEARYVSIIAVMNESERDIIKEAEMKLASLKRQVDEMDEETVSIDEENRKARKKTKKLICKTEKFADILHENFPLGAEGH